MATTIDSIAPGRFGINIVTGWQEAEYSQMSIWPGNAYFGYRYDYASEYVSVMKELWAKGVSDFKGKHITMNDCKMSPKPENEIKIIAAGQSGRGMEFASQYADFNFAMGTGVNTPTAMVASNERLVEASKKAGRDCGAYVLFMVIAEETDEEAEKKWQWYKDGLDVDAVSWMGDQSSKDIKADASATAKNIALPDGAVNLNQGTLVGSFAKVARLLDEVAEMPGTKGIMLTFDDFLVGMDKFGEKIQPLMKCRTKANGSNQGQSRKALKRQANGDFTKQQSPKKSLPNLREKSSRLRASKR